MAVPPTHSGAGDTARDRFELCALYVRLPLGSVRQDAALAEGVELVLYEARQLDPNAGFGVVDEAGRVPLSHRAPQPRARPPQAIPDFAEPD